MNNKEISKCQPKKLTLTPGITSQYKWIFCKDAMPKSRSYHKVIMETKNGERCIDFAEYIPEKEWWDFSKFNAIRKSKDNISNYSHVIAWMDLELPEPYVEDFLKEMYNER